MDMLVEIAGGLWVYSDSVRVCSAAEIVTQGPEYHQLRMERLYPICAVSLGDHR